MKRFYAAATREGTDRGHAILLDGKPVNTPARRRLEVPTAPLADAIAAEWNAQGETIAPATMKLTGLANAAIDRVAPDPPAFAAPLARYADSDQFCYRADAPADLVARQSAAWDPWLAWARSRYDVDFVVTAGIVHRAQPPLTLTRLAAAIAAPDAFRLAAMSPIVTIGGSLVAGLAVLEGVLAPDAAFDVTHLDELWQVEKWGDDAQAAEIRDARRADFGAATKFLALLSPSACG